MSKVKKLEEMFSKGMLNRRDFLIRASALGITTALSPAFFSISADAAMPKKGGRLRQGIAGSSMTDSLDTATLPNAITQNINFQIRNCLVEIDHKGTPTPELAESWEATSDASKWTFKIRKGIEFHNGKSLSAEDVIYSINHHRGEKSKSAVKKIVASIKDIKSEGKYSVVFELNTGNADFPFILSDVHLSIVPAGTTGSEWEKGIGTGAYMLVKHDPGVLALTKKNPNYWKEGRGHFDEIETIAIADISARTNALKTGQVDIINNCELKTVHLLKRSPGIQIINTTGFKHFTMPMLTDLAPYDNNDARLALKYAIDREQMLKMILRGYGSIGNDQPIGATYRFNATKSELAQRMYDPDKARFHLKKAGLENHVFNLHAADVVFSGAVDAAVLYQEQAAKAGININVVREPNDGYWSNVWNKKSFCMAFWAGRPTEDMMLSAAYSAGAPWNDSNWKNKRFNVLLKDARIELDTAKRREMYVEMQQLIRDKGGVIVPMFADHVDAGSSKLKFNSPAGNMMFDGQRNTERWWFA